MILKRQITNIGKFAFINLANLCSLLGVLPFLFLLSSDGFKYLPVLIIYNNVLDDLDGFVAKKLGIQSRLGAIFDNLCDVIAHTVVVWVVATHYSGLVLACALIATISIIIRVAKRIEDVSGASWGSPTNELMRHTLFLLLLEGFFKIEIDSYLAFVFLIHSFSLLIPYKMPHMIRSRVNSFMGIFLVNFLLVMAWQFSITLPFITFAFVMTYLYSLFVEGINWIRYREIKTGSLAN